MPAKKYLILLVWLLLSCVGSYAQHKNEKQVKALLKDAQYYLDNEDYLKSWESYKKVLTLDGKNETAGVDAAICASKLNYPPDSTEMLADNLSASKLPDAKYYLAKLRHKQKKFDEAIELLADYSKVDEKERLVNSEEVSYLYGICSNAKTSIAKPHLSVIRNMGANINSAYDDYVPVIMPDESAIYFTSKRKGSSGDRKNGDNSYFEDVYVSLKSDSTWKKAENVGFPINSEGNDACVSLSPDGHRMIVYRTSATDVAGGDLYITQQSSHGHWEPLKLLGPEINSEFIETSACFSKDTNEIYFSSNRPGGFGGKDIYRVRKLPNGHWAVPYNLGPYVNTAYDEDAPFLHPDGVTLYFSSKGHNTIGDYDVFKSTLDQESNQFSKTENLGYPINDVGNDIFFVLSVDCKRGYYSSVKKETFGGVDLYQVDTRFGDNDLVVKQAYAYLDSKPGRANITLIDNESNEIVGTYLSHPETGKFIMVLNPMKTYKVLVEEDGYENLETTILPVVEEKKQSTLRLTLKKANAK